MARGLGGLIGLNRVNDGSKKAEFNGSFKRKSISNISGIIKAIPFHVKVVKSG